jgi:ABC-type phosphate/phosphonate transport system substrate-binding protein
MAMGIRLASLPMYDMHRPSLTALWQGITSRLRMAGLSQVPDRLTWPARLVQHWQASDLLLSQTCGFPLMTSLAGTVQLVGAFAYDAPGCDGVYNRSQFVVRDSDPARSLEDLRGRRVAINGTDSQSGFNSLRAQVIPLARDGRFFGAAHVTGAHLLSVVAVRDGQADVASIDCVSLASFRKHRPDVTSGIRVLGESAPYPGLPLITSLTTSPASLQALREALAWSANAPALAQARANLLIQGFEPMRVEDYAVCQAMRAAAEAAGVDIA